MNTLSPQSLFNMRGKVALVTGATRGIGLAVARALAEAGSAVVISSENAADCDTVAQLMRDEGLDVHAIACDAASEQQVDALARKAQAWKGHIDVLVCNAGIAPHFGPLSTVSAIDYDATMTVNLRSALWLTSRVIPGMAERRTGSVVLMASISSLRGNKAIGMYGMSKAALVSLARNLAVEWGPSNVRVNAISPGMVRTEFARPLMDQPEVLQRRLELTPLRRVAEPLEIAGAALFLASAAGAFTTGHNLVVDGGTTIGDGN
jgi:NAD(P)-dependent dehydrogenase (short-subunit alcohol dehydrogenase family)